MLCASLWDIAVCYYIRLLSFDVIPVVNNLITYSVSFVNANIIVA